MLWLIALTSSVAPLTYHDVAILGASEDLHRPYLELLVFSGRRQTQHVRADELGNYVTAWGAVAYALDDDLRSADLRSNVRKGPFPPLKAWNFDFAVSPEGALLATYGAEDATLRIFSSKDGSARADVSSAFLARRGFKVSRHFVSARGIAFDKLGRNVYSSFPRSGQLSDAGELDPITIRVSVDKLSAVYVGRGAPVGWLADSGLVRFFPETIYAGSKWWPRPEGWFITTDGTHIIGARVTGNRVRIGSFNPRNGALLGSYDIAQLPRGFLVHKIAAFPCNENPRPRRSTSMAGR